MIKSNKKLSIDDFNDFKPETLLAATSKGGKHCQIAAVVDVANRIVYFKVESLGKVIYEGSDLEYCIDLYNDHTQ